MLRLEIFSGGMSFKACFRQSSYECVNLAKRESAPRRRRLGMGRFRNGEAAG